jgi:hypothetical protein
VTHDPRYPLGKPTNRPEPAPDLVPIPGRPNWYTPRKGGEPVYKEPPPPPPSPWNFIFTQP